MRNYFKPFLFLLLSAFALAACEENMDTEEEFVNWKEKNEVAFKAKLDEAHRAIAEAKSAYGEKWEEHCEWRAFRTYAQPSTADGKAIDSICVKIVEKGTGSGCPLYTDSVSLNYLGRLIPSPSYQDGYVFDHSSKGSPVSDVFNPDFARPAKFLVSNTVEGFTTALQKMHIGDRWLVYIPSELGYGATSSQALPGYSTLIFEMQLKGYARAGFPLK